MSRRLADRIAAAEHRIAHVPPASENEINALIKLMAFEELDALQEIGRELQDAGELDRGDGPLWRHPYALLVTQACRLRQLGYTVPRIEATRPQP